VTQLSTSWARKLVITRGERSLHRWVPLGSHMGDAPSRALAFLLMIAPAAACAEPTKLPRDWCKNTALSALLTLLLRKRASPAWRSAQVI
jgi:hypothetical protein